MPCRIFCPRLACASVFSLLTLHAGAQPAQVSALPPSGVVSLTTTATQEVTRDVLGVTFSTTREGIDAQAVQAALRQALEAALAEARKIARPGAVELQTGNFALYPRYTTPAKGSAATISGWQGSAELRVQGKDVAAIAQLSGRVSTMSIARVGYSLSREAREQVEGDVSARAIAAWRSKAGAISQQFGYANYSVREVSVGTNDTGSPPMPMLMKASRESAAADATLPTEAGKEEVTATVTGSAQMIR